MYDATLGFSLYEKEEYDHQKYHDGLNARRGGSEGNENIGSVVRTLLVFQQGPRDAP